MRNLWVVFICSIFVFVGCGGDSGVPAETTNGGEKNGESNGGEGNGGEGNGGEGNGGEGNGGEGNGGEGNGGEDNGGEGNGEECEPVLECPAGQCGEIDDGCGGVVECAEPCGCVDGAVQDPSCGICNLGSRVCQPGETGFGRCEELNVPGVSSCDDLVFIDPMTASHGGRGTKDEPLATIAEGLEAVRFRDAAALILAGDSDVEYEGPILLEAPLSIIGGFDSEWVANNERVKISSKGGASWLGPKDIVGVSIWEVDEPMVLANLFIKTDDAVDGGTNYGVHVHESPRLTIRNVEVGAGRGGSGSKGDNGVKGSDGDKGKDAVAVGRYKYRQQVNPLFVEYLHQEPSPGGGENNSCAEAKGGAGGTGGVTTIFADSNDGRDGQEALEAPGGRGASGGTNYAGENGGNAPTIQPTNASHGLPIIPARSVVDGAWVSERAAQSGSDGRDGSGGGGGGGGRAGFERAGIHFYIGSHGGGGGAGGCGGTGGKGGQAGGSSFGLFLSSSDITVENSSFYAANGGRGGDGGEGGRGGDGGLGGSATQRYGGNIEDPMVPIVYQTNEKGGDGGKGARGQNGGNGGGGAGGVSYGAYCYESEVTPVGTVIFESGAGGAGGKGGSQEFDGEDGLAEDVFKCF